MGGGWTCVRVGGGLTCGLVFSEFAKAEARCPDPRFTLGCRSPDNEADQKELWGSLQPGYHEAKVRSFSKECGEACPVASGYEPVLEAGGQHAESEK